MPPLDSRPDAVTAYAVVVRRCTVDLRYPWPHHVGALPMDEDVSKQDGTTDHP
jgi:hypothetical protein